MSLDNIPYIGQYSKSTHNFYVETGFNKWGMTGAMVSAMIIRDIILGNKNEYADIFSPSRNILRPQLAINGFEAIKNLLTISEKGVPTLDVPLNGIMPNIHGTVPATALALMKMEKFLTTPQTEIFNNKLLLLLLEVNLRV